MSQLKWARSFRTFSARSGRREASSSARRRARPGVEPLESRRLLASIAVFPTPSENSVPTSIVTGSDGNLWFTEF